VKKLLFLSFFILHFAFAFSQYMIYGVTYAGVDSSNQMQYGTIYKYNPITHRQTVVFWFNDTDGSPAGRLLYASDSLLYGLGWGGLYNMGTLYSFNPRTNVETVLVNMDSTNGYAGDGVNELIEGKDGLLYGTMMGGGKYGKGVLFSYDRHTHKDSIRCNFNDSTSDEGPIGGCYMELWQDTSTGILYGVTQFGGYPGGGGVIYGFNSSNNQLTRYYVGADYNTDPWQLSSGLTEASNGLLYGMAWRGGSYDSGCIYNFNVHTGIVQVVHSFNYTDGEYPNVNEFIQLSNGLLYAGVRQGSDILDDGTLISFDINNNAEKVLKSFNHTDGSQPFGRLIQDPDNGLLYGVTIYGGDTVQSFLGYGVLFSYDTGTRAYTKLFDFKDSNSIYPIGITLVKDTSVHVVKDSNTGIIEMNVESGWGKVYPNPANTMLNIEIDLQNGKRAYFEMYNNTGERIEAMELNSEITTLSINNLPSGMYYYRITDKSGSVIKADKQLIIH
jgi:uncharacterized repeat protein (TIGR03803 family)